MILNDQVQKPSLISISQPKFFTIPIENTNRSMNIFQEKVKLDQNFMTVARNYDIVGFNIVNDFNKRMLNIKQKESRKKARARQSYVTNSSRKQTKRFESVTKEALIQQLQNMSLRVKPLTYINQKENAYYKIKKSYENISSIWSAKEQAMKKKLGQNYATVGERILNFRSKFQQRTQNSIQQKKLHVNPTLWASNLRGAKLNELYNNQYVQKIIKAPKQLIISGQSKLNKQKQWIKNQPFSSFIHQNQTGYLQNN